MKKNKKVVVIYKGDDWNKKIPMKSILTRKSFEDWHERGLRIGVEMYRASFDWYDTKRRVFKKSWAYRDAKWIKVTTPIKPDLIYDKIAGKHDFPLFERKLGVHSKIKMFNSPLFRTSVNNKLSQYLILGEFMAKSYIAENEKTLTEAIKKIRSSKVVLKPLYGSGGFGIVIEERGGINKSKLAYPLLVQEFIKSETGIPGFSKKKELSDLRMIFTNHKLVYALSRIARPGSLFTNLHQGATAVIVPEKNIPESARKMAKKVIKKLSIFPEAHYSLDFIFTNSGRPILIEMNTTPGFDLLHVVGDEKLKDKNFKEFIKTLG